MKIAVLLFGHLRTFRKCADSLIENLLNNYDCDLFIHTWDVFQHSTKAWRVLNYFENNNLSQNDIDFMISKYKPKLYLIEKQIKNKSTMCKFMSKPYTEVDINGMKHMFHSMSSANSLRKEYENTNNIKYDWIVVTRPDVIFYNPLKINDVIEQSKIIGLDLNKYRFFAYDTTSSYHNIALVISRVSDILFMGKSNVIDTYCDIYKMLDDDFIRSHILNDVSVFTSAEIKLGIIPTPMGFVYKTDWENLKE